MMARRRAPRSRPPRSRSGRAFTLLELVVSTGIISLVVGSLASIMVLASRALPSSAGALRANSAIAAAAAADELASDLRFATTIIETTPSRIAFTVPDRTGDAVDETIVYQWAGPGAPLLRSINGGDPITLLDSLQTFNLDYTRHTQTQSTIVSTVEESEELLLSSFTGWAGVPHALGYINLTGTTWAAEKFVVDKVTIPSDVTSWRISRVSVRLRRPSTLSAHAVTVGIHFPTTSGGFLPAALPIGTPGVIPSAHLTTTAAWHDATFSDVVFTDPTRTHFVIVVKPELPTNIAYIEYYSERSAPTDAYVFQYTTDGGSSWLPTSNRQRNDAPFFVYGRYTRGSTGAQVTETHTLRRVGITLQMDDSGASRLSSAVQLANQPEAPAP
jgi:type II secretory pathway pseudopilin PulG